MGAAHREARGGHIDALSPHQLLGPDAGQYSLPSVSDSIAARFAYTVSADVARSIRLRSPDENACSRPSTRRPVTDSLNSCQSFTTSHSSFRSVGRPSTPVGKVTTGRK